jgi:hypothetical protein
MNGHARPALKEPDNLLTILVGRVVVIPMFHEIYVREILDEAAHRGRLSRDEFYRLFRPSLSAGYWPEVDEAARRYFTQKRNPVHAKSAA